MEDNHIWILMSKVFSGAASVPEKKELENLMKTHPESQYTFEILSSVWPVGNERFSEMIPPEIRRDRTSEARLFGEDLPAGRSFYNPLFVSMLVVILLVAGIAVYFYMMGNLHS